METGERDGSRSESSDDADETKRSERGPLAVVGIGASAGGLAALQKLFANVPDDTGIAYVVVVHLSPEHESHLAELLQPHVRMPVQQVAESVALEPDRVFVIPPNANLDSIDTHLRLSDLEDRRSERAPIDHFFRTLARTHDGHAIGVILTGTGTDGTLGLKDIKENGGLTIVGDPAEAEYDGMPQSAIATGLIDLILPIDEIPEAILRFTSAEPSLPEVAAGVELGGEDRRTVHRIFGQLRARTGRDFSRYKYPTVIRRIGRRMQLHQVATLADYLAMLASDPEELLALADDLLITVTRFFRDPEAFEAVERSVIPALFEDKGPDDEVRVWTVGCATGEEAYSLAILLLEEAGRRELAPTLKVFASDLHERSLATAREGFYAGDIDVDVGEPRLKRYFEKRDGGYRIRKEVRDLVVFAPQNLLADPPFSRLDLIACRNVLIYLQREAQLDVVDLFHYALRDPGFLMVGTSETLDTAELFKVENKAHGLYRRRNVPGPDPRLPVFPLARTMPRPVSRDSGESATQVAYGSLHHRMVERYAPPSILISPDDRIVHLSEQAGRYLLHPGGDPTTNVYRVVREELRLELRAALHAARSSGTPQRSEPIEVRFDGEVSVVRLDVRVAPGGDDEDFGLVIFDERGEPDEEGDTGTRAPDADTDLQRVESQLALARKRLQTIIEEYESSQEEMQASNEELQSSNEELRSTMEELETSKEELQSMNEELQTVNQENRHKVAELAQLSSDLQNLLTATDIATVFLDRDLRILRFTPKVEELFNVRLADRGRPLTDLSHRLVDEEVAEGARRVLERLVPVEHEVRDSEGSTYLTRILPYRGVDDRIEGVVITFVDITRRRNAEEALKRLNETLESRVEERTREVRDQEEQFRRLVEASTQTVWMTDAGGRIVEDSPSWRSYTGQTSEERSGEGWIEAIHPADRADVTDRWYAATDHGEAVDIEFRLRDAASEAWKWTNLRAVPLRGDDGAIRGWIGMNIDIHGLRGAEQEVRELAASLTIAEQEERRRISQVLHDDLQQLLYAIEMNMSMGRKEMAEAGADGLLPQIDRSLELLARAIIRTRQLTVDLTPPVLHGEGLVDALQWLQSQMADLHHLAVDIRADDGEVTTTLELRILLFQVIRELLFNVAKHAETDRATVELGVDEDGIRVSVSDQGRGFEAGEDTVGRKEAGGFGLSSVRERLRLHGGVMSLRSAPDEGTRVTIQVPSPRSGSDGDR